MPYMHTKFEENRLENEEVDPGREERRGGERKVRGRGEEEGGGGG